MTSRASQMGLSHAERIERILESLFFGKLSQTALQDLFRREPDGWAYLLALAQTLPLTLRRIRPIPVLFIVAGSFMIDRGLDYPSTIAVTGVLFAFHAIGSELPRRQSLVIGLGTAAVLTLFTLSGVAYNESVEFGTVLLVLVAQNQHAFGLVEPAQIVEVTVLPIGVLDVVVAYGKRRRGKDGDPVPHGLEKLLSTCGKLGHRAEPSSYLWACICPLLYRLQ